MVLIYSLDVPGSYPVTIHKQGATVYRVTYGKQVKVFPALLLALTEAESCAVHALTCVGAFDAD